MYVHYVMYNVLCVCYVLGEEWDRVHIRIELLSGIDSFFISHTSFFYILHSNTHVSTSIKNTYVCISQGAYLILRVHLCTYQCVCVGLEWVNCTRSSVWVGAELHSISPFGTSYFIYSRLVLSSKLAAFHFQINYNFGTHFHIRLSCFLYSLFNLISLTQLETDRQHFLIPLRLMDAEYYYYHFDSKDSDSDVPRDACSDEDENDRTLTNNQDAAAKFSNLHPSLNRRPHYPNEPKLVNQNEAIVAVWTSHLHGNRVV